MEASSSSKVGSPFEASCNFFSHSKVWITASLVAEAVTLIIGVLAITHILPGVGPIPQAVITGFGGFFFVLSLSFVCSRFYAKVKKIASENHPISSSQTKCEIPKEEEKADGASDSRNLEEQSSIIDSWPAWKKKLEQLRINNQGAAPQTPLVPPEECLNVLSFLAQKGVSTKLFKETIPYNEPANAQMKILVKKYKNKKGKSLYKPVANAFAENLPALNTFIRSQTQSVLLEAPTEEERMRFKILNKQIRMILFFLMSQERDKAYYLEKYKYHLEHSLGNREWSTIDSRQPFYYFARFRNQIQEKSQEFYDFLFVFSTYRRHFLLRSWPKKNETFSAYADNMKIKTLLSATWFHGTRAATSLSNTDFILMPTGWLHQVGHLSFFGEMGRGCQIDGVNANSLSGTCLDHVDWSVNSYATGFQFDIDEEIHTVNAFLKLSITTDNFCNYDQRLPRVEVAIKRWARWDQIAFKEKIPLILSQLNKFEAAISETQKNKPKEIFNWHDHYHSSKYDSVCYSVEQIKAFVSDSLPSGLTEKEKENIEENFPAVFGSTTLLSKPVFYDDRSGEYLVPGIAEVGKDLQLLCVQEDDLEKATKWVEDSLPNAGIQIFTFEDLKNAQEVNKIVSPYLADIFSLKKFNKLCG